jgi:hypothetical protein
MKNIFVFVVACMISFTLLAQGKQMTEIKPKELPKGVNSWVSKNIPGGQISRAGKIVENKVVTYVAVIESRGTKHAYQFDKDGKFVGKADNLFQNQSASGGVKQAPAANTDPKQQAAPSTKPASKPATATQPKDGASDEAPKK